MITPPATPPPPTPAVHVRQADAATVAPLPSEALLQGRKTVEISHNGRVYRLQATRQGKLILTK